MKPLVKNDKVWYWPDSKSPLPLNFRLGTWLEAKVTKVISPALMNLFVTDSLQYVAYYVYNVPVGKTVDGSAFCVVTQVPMPPPNIQPMTLSQAATLLKPGQKLARSSWTTAVLVKDEDYLATDWRII